MPISREEFDERHIDLTVPIAEVLESNPSLAFTAEEMLQDLTELWARRVTLAEVAVALETLVSAGQAARAEFAGQRWYTCTIAVED